MDLIDSQIAELQEQLRCLPELVSTVSRHTSTISSLSSMNEAQASTIARLSAENENFKRINKAQELVIGELSRASVPGGFWVWESRSEEGREDEGRWVWSLEKYRVLSPPVVASGPPTSLLSLPVELLDIILELLEKSQHLALCKVSFKLLELSYKYVYKLDLTLSPEEAYDFVNSRVSHPSPKSERITTLLLPKSLYLDGAPVVDQFKDLVDLAPALANPPSPLRVEALGVGVSAMDDFTLWMDILPFIDPFSFEFRTVDYGNVLLPPTIRFVPANFVDSFTSNWSRLEQTFASGPNSLLLVEGTEQTSAFEACLRRCSPALPFVVPEIWIKRMDGTETGFRLEETEVVNGTLLDPSWSLILKDLEMLDGEIQLVWLCLGMREARIFMEVPV